MPIIKSAKKKLRKDKKRTTNNVAYEKAYKDAIKKLKSGGKDVKSLMKKAYSVIDKAAKKGVIHKNKANRLKSEISKLSKRKKSAK